MIEYLVYLLLGSVAGVLAGLLGLGGVVLMPGFLLAFSWQGFPQALVLHMAITTSLACVVVASGSASIVFLRNGMIRWPLFYSLAPGVVLGGVLGALLSLHLPAALLSKIVAFVLILTAGDILFSGKFRKQAPFPALPWMLVWGMITGMLGAVVGVSAALFLLVMFRYCQIPMREGVAIATMVGWVSALIVTLIFVFTVAPSEGLVPTGSVGYLFLPAFVVASIASVIAVSLIARWSQHFSPAVLKKIFGTLLASVALRMAFFD